MTNCVHTKKGNRMNVSPFARSWMIVVMKLIAPSSDEVIRKIIPMSHTVWPVPARIGERRIGRPPGLRGSPGDEEAGQHGHAAEEEEPVARHVEPRERHVRGSNLERDDEVPESADGERHDAEEDHDGAVHRPELVVELGEHRPARHARLAEDAAEQRQRRARIGELPPHEHHQRKAEEEEQQAGDGVLDADDLVVDGEDVLTPEAERLVMGFVRDVRLVVRRQLPAHSCGCPPNRYFVAGRANLKSWVFVSLAPTVTVAVCVPSLSCQAVIS